MPRFEKDENLELKQYLELILNEINVNRILDSIVNNDTDILWNFVVGYKLIAHQLDRLRITDPELAYLTGQFLGYYKAVENLHKKYKDKKEYTNKLDKIISENNNAVDILSDLYMVPALSEKYFFDKYNKNVSKDLENLKKEEIVEYVDNEIDNYYLLSDNSRLYMKEHYFYTFEIEKEKDENSNDNLRSKTLHLLREENKKGGIKWKEC